MNYSLRSSRVTGPKIRVPIGCSLLLFKITHAITIEANDRRTVRATNAPFLVRTTTAFSTSPFDLTTRNRFFDGDLNDVAYACVATVRLSPERLIHITRRAPGCRRRSA